MQDSKRDGWHKRHRKEPRDWGSPRLLLPSGEWRARRPVASAKMRRPATEVMLRAAWRRAANGIYRSHFFLPEAGAALIYKRRIPINFSPFGALSDTGTFLHANRSLRFRPSRSMFSRCWFSRCWRCLARRTYTDNSTPSMPVVRSRYRIAPGVAGSNPMTSHTWPSTYANWKPIRSRSLNTTVTPRHSAVKIF
jgi:hypothetical protein